jgi:hypothetical protein
MPEPVPEPEATTPQPAGFEHRGPQHHPLEEKRGPVTEALVQTAQDLKDVGLGVVAAYAYDQWRKPKDPPRKDQ